MMEKPEIKDKPTLTIEEAACLYNIGEHKLRELTDSNNCTVSAIMIMDLMYFYFGY